MGIRTATGGVVTGLLAEESRVLHCVACQSLSALWSFPGSATQRAATIASSAMPSSQLQGPNFIQCGLPSASLARIGGCVRTLRAEELAGDVKGLAPHNNDLLAVEELLGDGAGKATEQVALAVDDLCGLSARRPWNICGVWKARWPESQRQRLGYSGSWSRGVRTMTGSNVDILLDSGVL